MPRYGRELALRTSDSRTVSDLRAERFARLALTCALVSLTSCVQVNRFEYVSLESTEGVVAEGSVLPDCAHLISVDPIPEVYTLSREKYSLRFEALTTNCYGGVWISATSPASEPLRITSKEPAIAEPGYGNCRKYYSYDRPSDLLFVDMCRESLTRSFFISIDVVGPDGVVGRERIPYELRRNGFWWTEDHL